MAGAPLLEPGFLKKLDRLTLAGRRPFAGQMKGEKRSTRRGASVEFADYREYATGDDLRYVDWNTAARLDKLFLKLYVEEEDVFLSLLVDTSASMAFGDPSKMDLAVRTAAALGYVSLVNYDRVAVQAFGGEAASQPARRGRQAVVPLFGFLSTLAPVGEAHLEPMLRRCASAMRTRGIALLFSDLMDAKWQDGVKALLARGCQVGIVHVLSPSEAEPDLRGDLRIIDSETGDERELSVTAPLLARYAATFAAFCNDAEQFCGRRGVDYVRVTTNTTVEDLVLHELRRLRMVQ